jgi:RNA polymerase sigma-70 factor (ECF subfamily)
MRQSASGDELSDYHLEAEIASCHSLASDFESTDWQRVLRCYEELYRRNHSPVVALNRVVALSRVRGVDAALNEIVALSQHRALQSYCPFFVVHAELMMKAGRHADAAALLRRATELTSSEPVLAYLEKRIRLTTSRDS